MLDTKSYVTELSDRYVKLFQEIQHKATHCNNVATLQNIKLEADALKVRLINEMDKKDEAITARRVAEEKAKYATTGVSPTTPPPLQPTVKKKKNISIKSVSVSSSWQIETIQDVDKHMAALRAQILKELEEDTIVNIEF